MPAIKKHSTLRISKLSGKSIHPKRSRSARKAALTRKKNALLANPSQVPLTLRQKLIAASAVFIVIIFTAYGISAQLGVLAASSSSGAFIGIGGKCLDNEHSKLVDTNKIQLYRCNGTNAQKWNYTSDGALVSSNGSGKFCLDVTWGNTKEYTYLQLYHCNGTNAQKFSLTGNQIINTATGYCATDHFAETANGNRIWMKACHSSTAQSWVYSGKVNIGGSGNASGSGNGSSSGGSSASGGSTAGGPSGSGGATGPVTTPVNYDFNAVVKGLTSPTGLSLKAGTYTLTDFSFASYYGAWSKNITAITGAGVSDTIIQMAPKTSTKANNIPTQTGTTNQYDLMRVDGTQTLSNFTLRGTDQGHLYNGLTLYYSTGSKVSNVKAIAIPGNNHFPPGETFGINEFHGNNNVYNNVEVDGAGVGASGFGLNSSSNETFNNSYSHGNSYSIGWAFWQNTGGAIINNSNSSNNRGGVNFERATGTYYLNNMTFGGNGNDISGGQDQNGYFKVIVKDPKFLNGQTKLKVNWFSTENGVADKYGKSSIQVLVNGVDETSTLIQWQGVGAG